MKKIMSSLFVAAAMFAGTAALAQEHATAQQAQDLLDKAVAKINADGADKAFAAFDDPKGGFISHELYVFVFSMDGHYKASGANPKLVGSDAHELKDAAGKPLVHDMIELAKTKGAGEVDYVWLNRYDNHVENKHSLVRRVGDYVVGVGYYLQ